MQRPRCKWVLDYNAAWAKKHFMGFECAFVYVCWYMIQLEDTMVHSDNMIPWYVCTQRAHFGVTEWHSTCSVNAIELNSIMHLVMAIVSFIRCT